GCQIGQQDARSDVVRRVDVEVHGWHAVGAGVGDVLVLYAAHEDAEEVVVQVGRSRVGTDESGQVGSGVAERASPGDGHVQARDYEVVLLQKPDHRVEVTRGAGDHPMLHGLRVRDVRAGAGFAAVRPEQEAVAAVGRGRPSGLVHVATGDYSMSVPDTVVEH